MFLRLKRRDRVKPEILDAAPINAIKAYRKSRVYEREIQI